MSTTTDNDAEQLYRRWIDDLWSAGEPIARELVSEDFVGHLNGGGGVVRGPDELQAVVDANHARLRDVAFEISVGPFPGGEMVASRWTARHVSEDGHRAITGNDMLRLEGGVVVEYWTASTPVTG